MNNKIFVQIASYRDPELIPTIKDLIDKSNNPENLVIVVAWQHGADENLTDFLTANFEYKASYSHKHLEVDNSFKEFKVFTLEDIDKKAIVKLIDVDYNYAKGACWARHLIQTFYEEEEYTLQLDSHHRFVEGWDAELITMLNQLKEKGHEKPLLTSYIPSFDPDNDPDGRVQVPWWMTFDRFIPEGAVFFLPAELPDWRNRNEPIPARFYSAHFAFTGGEFAKEVMHDPNYYFHGEEISIAVRAFTHGYDLFHPHKVIAWHEYTRKGRTKHWDDDASWSLLNEECHRRNRILFGIQESNMPEIEKETMFGKYGFGKKRSLQDYEKYAGLRFKDQSVQKYTLENNIAPNPILSEKDYNESFLRRFKHCIDIHKTVFENINYQFCVVAFHNENEDTLYRKDLTKEEIDALLSNSKGSEFINIWSEFYPDEKVSYWVVWPYDINTGWAERLTGSLEYR